jgi:ubiquinone biosynthesis monooxygenase Coq7
MACTVGVERVIASHYNDQLRELVQHTPHDTELRGIIKRFRDEEMDHHDWSADAGGKGTTLVDSFTQLVDWGTKLAVVIAKRI